MPAICTRTDAQGNRQPAWVNPPPRIRQSDIDRYGSAKAAREAMERNG